MHRTMCFNRLRAVFIRSGSTRWDDWAEPRQIISPDPLWKQGRAPGANMALGANMAALKNDPGPSRGTRSYMGCAGFCTTATVRGRLADSHWITMILLMDSHTADINGSNNTVKILQWPVCFIVLEVDFHNMWPFVISGLCSMQNMLSICYWPAIALNPLII